VDGQSTQTVLVAVVVPDMAALGAWAAANGLKGDAAQPAELARNPKVARFLEQQLAEVAARAQLRGFEVVKRVFVATEDFTVENGLLTPTMKLKRHEVRKRYAKEIDALYLQVASKL
jgi:long-chain acyl-CoA synthetase